MVLGHYANFDYGRIADQYFETLLPRESAAEFQFNAMFELGRQWDAGGWFDFHGTSFLLMQISKAERRSFAVIVIGALRITVPSARIL